MRDRDHRADHAQRKQDAIDRHAGRTHHGDFTGVTKPRQRQHDAEQGGERDKLTDDLRRSQRDIPQHGMKAGAVGREYIL